MYRWFFVVVLVFFPSLAFAQEAPSCESVPDYEKVRFIIGDWQAYYGGDPYFEGKRYRVGTNKIRATETGCAISESWASIGGVRGSSLFYYSEADETWKQVGIGPGSEIESGEVYEKLLTETDEEGMIRFQGEITTPSGSSYLERSTYKPLPDGSVHFHYESSRDGGETWEPVVVVVYGVREDT